MPCAQGWVCQGFVQPARYLIFSTCMPVSGSSISGIEGSSTPSWGIGNGTHSWVLVSMAVSSTGFSSSDMGDHFLLAITAPRVSARHSTIGTARGEGQASKPAAQHRRHASAARKQTAAGTALQTVIATPGSAVGLFVPKPSTGAGYQRCGMPDLGSTVRRCPLASTAVGSGCYSLGYSVVREPVVS